MAPSVREVLKLHLVAIEILPFSERTALSDLILVLSPLSVMSLDAMIANLILRASSSREAFFSPIMVNALSFLAAMAMSLLLSMEVLPINLMVK
uniref:hypothetical protein n=1 Tax=Prevotella micans TaxID=189723 RepID=UPI001EE21AE8|nr:hypothetical protein [Prevotella micans]